LKDLLKLLPQKLFVVDEDVLRWFLQEIEDAHDKYQTYGD